MSYQNRTIIDLSHTITPNIPMWPGDPAVAIESTATIATDGYLLHRLQLGEASGTHVAYSAHFHPNGRRVDDVPVTHLLLPAVCIDVRDEVAKNPDFMLGANDVQKWEAVHGQIPAQSVVLLCTGWDRYWDSPERYLAAPTPGYAVAAAQMLAQQRGVLGLGIDTHGIDPGTDATFGTNRYWLQGERFHLENLTNLGLVPPTGCWLFIGALNIAGGAGSPARVIAMTE